MRHRPTAPPVYRPQPVPRVLQRKIPTAYQSPGAPPAYRPQPTPKVLQTKKAGLGQLMNPNPVALAQANAAYRHNPAVPPAYPPELKKVVQRLMTRHASNPSKVRTSPVGPTGLKEMRNVNVSIQSSQSKPSPAQDQFANRASSTRIRAALRQQRRANPISAAVQCATATPMGSFAQLPSEVTAKIASYVGAPRATPGGNVATQPEDLAAFARSSRGLYGIIRQNQFRLGLPQARAQRVYADRPHHKLVIASDKFENFYIGEEDEKPFPALEVEPDSRNIFKARRLGSVFSGVVNIRTGRITLYPLATDEDYPQNKGWVGNATFHGEAVVPIAHQQDPRAPESDPEAVSHEVLAMYILHGQAEDYAGFTLWSEQVGHNDVVFVWSSRALNENKFHSGFGQGGGHTNKWLAEQVAAACARDLQLSALRVT